MSGLFKSPAPDSAFSLGDDEDPSLGEVGHAVSVWKAQPAANVAHGSALLALGNGSVHVDNSQPPPAEASISKPSTQSRTVEQEGGAQADAAQDLQANGKHESPGSQVDHPQTSSSESRPTAQPSAQADSFTPSPLPHHEGESSPVAASQPSKSEEEDRIAEELAALEAEAEALALQEQRQSGIASGSSPFGKAAGDGGASVPLSDDHSRAVDHAMAEARQVSASTAAMQSSLDAYAPRARPFSPPPGSAPLQRFSPVPDFQEPPQFAGLLYWDGIDAVGRPVIVVNADAVSEDKVARRAAADYILHLLEPIVIRGPYVIVMVNNGRNQRSNRLPGSWFIGMYRGLARPFRKNVKIIILVRPSKPLRAFLALIRPFISRKAHRKVVKVESLSAISDATGGEVTLAHLGQRFAEAAGRHVSENLSLTSPTLRGAGGSSPPFASSPTGGDAPLRATF